MKTPIKVMIIDDNRADSTLLGYCLEKLPLYQVNYVICESGEEASEKMNKWNADVVFVDYILGAEIGTEVITRLKKDNRSHAEFILLTGFGGEHTAVEALRVGANDYLSKEELSLDTLERTMRHVSERKQAKEERTLLATTIEQAWEVIVITDSDGIIQYVNPAFAQVTGYKAEEAIGKNPRILKSGKHDEAFYSNLWNTINGGKVWRGHFINKKKDGTLYEEDATITPVSDPFGNIVNFVAVKRDVTKEVMLEKQIRQAQKMEAIGTLAGGIAHDFNNILTPIIGYAEMARGKLPEASEVCEEIDAVIKAGNRAKELIKHILTFSREEEHEFKPVQLHLIVKETLKLLRASIPATIDIRQDIDPNAGVVLADAAQMHQVIMNLCSNAEHTMREKGGVLEVTLKAVCFNNIDQYDSINFCRNGDKKCENIVKELEEDFANANVMNIKEGAYIKLTVSDTGYGMNKAVMDRIFDPFFTTKSIGEGTGMGLSAVHGIVANHDGAIIVKSKLGEGSEFQVYIPLIESDFPTDNSLKQPIPRGRESILFVDDEEAITRLCKQLLEQLGYKVEVSNSSLDALAAFRADPQKFDIVITDQTMPNMTGEKLARELLEIRPDLPIILCSGFSYTITPEKAKAIGIREYLMKPIVTRELSEAIRQQFDNKKKKRIWIIT